MNFNIKPYTGEKLRTEKEFEYFVYAHDYDKEEEKGFWTKTETKRKDKIPPYLPDDDLQEVVRLTQILERPLIIRGEPGSGKTKLARALAFEIYDKDYRQHYFEWHIKSTSKATDGLYTFDHIQRLRDAQTLPEGEDMPNARKYRKFGPLGKAFTVSTKENPAIVLIDEIDKADIDFPNDLLLELDELRFKIEETGEEIKAEHPPIIFITSNDEKELPAAFLRRCLFHYINFPSKEKLKDIVKANYPKLLKEKEGLTDQALERFVKLREAMDSDQNAFKNVSTSELLDWMKVINYHFEAGTMLDKIPLTGMPPHYQVLLKSYSDILREKKAE